MIFFGDKENRARPFLFSTLILIMAWMSGSILLGPRLLPWPSITVRALGGLLLQTESWRHICVTIFRGLAGLGIAFLLALLLGVPTGLNRRSMDLVAPLIAAFQATPGILWITLLMVWNGPGNLVPLTVVVLALFPPLFAGVSQGAASLEPRLLALSKIYRLKKTRFVIDILRPHLRPYLLAGLSHGLGTTWRVAAVAEFFGASNGIGARLYWSYRELDMPKLFAWALILVVAGLVMEFRIIRPLRRKAEME